jgi:hypothetical protein
MPRGSDLGALSSEALTEGLLIGDPILTPSHVPTLTVLRDRGFIDKLRKYSIFVDGLEAGQVSDGGALHLQITPGHHVVEAKIDWCGSRPLHFYAQLEHEVVRVRSGLRGWRFFLVFFYVIFNRHGYLTLELVR